MAFVPFAPHLYQVLKIKFRASAQLIARGHHDEGGMIAVFIQDALELTA